MDFIIGVSANDRATLDLFAKHGARVFVTDAVLGATCDLGVLNKAGCIDRFEALKGRLLFCRPRCLEVYADFYTRTCRQYEEYFVMLSRYNAWRAA